MLWQSRLRSKLSQAALEIKVKTLQNKFFNKGGIQKITLIGKNPCSGPAFIYNEAKVCIQIGRWKFEIYENRLAGPSFRVVALERNIVEHNIIKLG